MGLLSALGKRALGPSKRERAYQGGYEKESMKRYKKEGKEAAKADSKKGIGGWY